MSRHAKKGKKFGSHGSFKTANKIIEDRLNKPKTFGDLMFLLTGHSGGKIKSAPYSKDKAKFGILLNKLAKQISSDNGGSNKTPNDFIFPSDKTQLSQEATRMFETLKRIQEKMLP